MVPNNETSSSANDCDVCKIISTGKTCVGGLVFNPSDNWTLNHYGGEEGFLGWLALSPNKHIGNFKDLNKDESSELGYNLKLIETALRSCWSEQFQNDQLERLYALCFSEYSKGHFHFHLIPRTNKLRGLLKNEEGDIIPWHTYKIHGCVNFPEEYVIRCNCYNENVENLMTGLQKRIKELSKTNK